MQKCIKLKIIKPIGEITWNEFGKVLRDTVYAVSKMSNHIMREHYLNTIKKLNGEETEKVYCYPIITKMFPDVPGQICNQMEQVISKKWKACSKDVLNLRQSLPTFKLNMAVSIHNKAYKLIKEDNNYVIDAQLCSNKCDRTRYQFVVAANDGSTKAILNRIITGEYGQGAGQITKDRNNKWFFILPYSFEPQYSDVEKDNIMGLDLGIAKAAYWAYNNSHKRGYIEGSEIEEFRRRVRARRISIQKQGKFCGEGRNGHGVTRKLLPVDILADKESNFRDTCNARYASYIVGEARKNKCGIIQMEDLTSINELSKFLKNWPYYDLQTKIINKAAEFGIEVRKVNPQYTSQRCSNCGHIDKSSRKDQSTFVCTSCGFGSLNHCFSCNNKQTEEGACGKCGEMTKKVTVNADYNAARNLSTEGIEDIISKEISGVNGGEVKPAKVKRTRKV